MSNVELLTCPFCGGEVKLDEDGCECDFCMFCCEECGAGITFAKEQDGFAEDAEEGKMITKTQFKDAAKKAIICTIMNYPEIIYNLDQDQDGAMKILVGFYKTLIKKLYRKRGELKDCNEINEIYVIAFECLYKEDGETPAYVIYEENMLCLSSVNALTDMCREVRDDYYCELASEIEKALEEEE